MLAGSLPTASGLRRVAAVDASIATDILRAVVDAATVPAVVHCCAPEIPFSCIKGAGAAAVSFDLSLLRRADEDAFGEAVESGIGMFIGAVPTSPPARVPGQRQPTPGQRPAGYRSGSERSGGERSGGQRSDRERSGREPEGDEARATAAAVIDLWLRIGLPSAGLTRQVVITPACGLAGATADYARAALGLCREAAGLIPELIEEGVR